MLSMLIVLCVLLLLMIWFTLSNKSWQVGAQFQATAKWTARVIVLLLLMLMSTPVLPCSPFFLCHNPQQQLPHGREVTGRIKHPP
jgi:hypothetical protein